MAAIDILHWIESVHRRHNGGADRSGARHDRHRFPVPPAPRLAGRIRRAGRPHAADRSNHSGLHLAQGFWSDDGERVTIVEFEHEEGQRAWRMHPEHIEAQKLGRLKYYEMYDIKVAQVTFDHHFERKTEAAAGA